MSYYFEVRGDLKGLKCSGCKKGAFIPGCPIHDPEKRKEPL